jgi:hypothetical protein
MGDLSEELSGGCYPVKTKPPKEAEYGKLEDRSRKAAENAECELRIADRKGRSPLQFWFSSVDPQSAIRIPRFLLASTSLLLSDAHRPDSFIGRSPCFYPFWTRRMALPRTWYILV